MMKGGVRLQQASTTTPVQFIPYTADCKAWCDSMWRGTSIYSWHPTRSCAAFRILQLVFCTWSFKPIMLN